jgi:histidinol-phosphate/aromatic aminotransferase/cobyric acid decarboxylase-like protein
MRWGTPYLEFCIRNMPNAKHDFASSQMPFRDLSTIKVESSLLDMRPSQAIRFATETLAERYGVEPGAVMLGPGALGALAGFYAALVRARGPQIVAIESPGYEGLGTSAIVFGHQVVQFVSEPDADEQDFQLPDGCGCVVISNPNNPTGLIRSNKSIAQLADCCANSGALLLIDESYQWFVKDPINSSAVHLRKNVFVESPWAWANQVWMVDR